MLIDTSAIVAIHNREDGFEDLLKSIANAKRRWLSAVSYVESVMVTKNQNWIDGFLKLLDIEMKGLSPRDAEEAIKAFFRYEKGIHPAKLNFGHCLVYGTARPQTLICCSKGNIFLKPTSSRF